MANTQVATRDNTALANSQPKTGIAAYLGGDKVRKNIAGVIGESNVTRFISSIVSAVQINPKLAACTNGSILNAALQGEALQLAPSPQLGQFYMVPYDKREKVNGKWETVSSEAQFQMGWKGYVQLAIRSGQYRKIVVSEIKFGEAAYNPITEDIILSPIMDPEEREKAETVGYYVMFELVNGFRKDMYWPRAKMDAHARKYSKAYQYDLKEKKSSSVWTTDFDAMAKKTMIRQLLSKWGIMSVEMQQAFEKDMSVIDEDGTARYIDNDSAINVEAQVQQDIAENANTVEFQPAIEQKPEQPTVAEVVGKATKATRGKEPVPTTAKAEPAVEAAAEEVNPLPDFMRG